MFNCKQCKRRICIKTGIVCSRINRILKRIGIYRDNYIRPAYCKNNKFIWRELPFSSLLSSNINKKYFSSIYEIYED